MTTTRIAAGPENGPGARGRVPTSASSTGRSRSRRRAGEGEAGHVPIPVITILNPAKQKTKKVPLDPVIEVRLAEAATNPKSQDAADLLCDLAAEGRLSLVKKMIDEYHVNVNVRESTGRAMALHAGAYEGKLSICRYLVRYKADAKARDVDGRTPLHLAVARKHAAVALLLVQKAGADVMAFDREGKTPLSWAISKNGSLDLIKGLIIEGHFNVQIPEATTRDTLGHIAARARRLDVMMFLCQEMGLNANTTGRLGFTMLHIAAHNGYLEIVQWLLTIAKASVSASAGGGTLPHLLAMMEGHLAIVFWLIGQGQAPVDAKNTITGETVLHMAAAEGDTGTVRWLVEEGQAKLTALNDKGESPLNLAAAGGHEEVVEYLKEQTKRHKLKQKRHKNSGSNGGVWTVEAEAGAAGGGGKGEGGRASLSSPRSSLPTSPIPSETAKGPSESNGGGEEEAKAATEETEEEAAARKARNQKRREKMKKAKAKKSGATATGDAPCAAEAGEEAGGGEAVKTTADGGGVVIEEQKEGEDAEGVGNEQLTGVMTGGGEGAMSIGDSTAGAARRIVEIEEKMAGVTVNEDALVVAAAEGGGGVPGGGELQLPAEEAILVVVEPSSTETTVQVEESKERNRGPRAASSRRKSSAASPVPAPDVDLGVDMSSPAPWLLEGSGEQHAPQVAARTEEEAKGESKPPTAPSSFPAEEMTEEQQEQEQEEEPEDYICPVSLVLMTDPVLATDGLSYQREALQAHIDFSASKGLPLRSPVTGMPMEPMFFPNIVLRRLVMEYLDTKKRQRGGVGSLTAATASSASTIGGRSVGR